MKTVLIVFGTRPEVIKMAPVVRACQESKGLRPVLCATAQHRQLLDQELSFLGLRPDHDLDLMRPNQDLSELTAQALLKLKAVLQAEKPDVVLVQGDTTTAFVAGLAAFYQRVPVGHVEAGLRTGDLYSPFPEEVNRRLIGAFAHFHFAPTKRALENLRKENHAPETLFLTGNTGIDSLLWAASRTRPFPGVPPGKAPILMTSHRRENFGAPMGRAFGAIRDFSDAHPEFQILYPVHPNPNVVKVADQYFRGASGVTLLPPLQYPELVAVLKDCHLVITDSGGLQEEAPTFGKPVVVLRENTERPEAVEAGCARLVGTDPVLITQTLDALAQSDSELYRSMANAKNPFGDGTAAQQIVNALQQQL